MDGIWHGAVFNVATNFSYSLSQLPILVYWVSQGAKNVKEALALEKGTDYFGQEYSDSHNAGAGRIP